MALTCTPSVLKLWEKGWDAACLAGTAFTRSAVTAKTASASATSPKTDRRRRRSDSRLPGPDCSFTATAMATVDSALLVPGIGSDSALTNGIRSELGDGVARSGRTGVDSPDT